MNKQEFINSLINALAGLPQEEIDKSVDFYSEMIDDAVENGESEEEVTSRLGGIDEIAKKIINDTPLSKVVKENVKKSDMSTGAVILLIVLSPIWFPVAVSLLSAVIAVYASLWTVIASLFSVFAAFALSGIALLVAAPFLIAAAPFKAMLAFGTALLLMGLSVFLFYLSVICAKLIIKLTVFIGQKIKNALVKRGGADNEKR